MRLTARHTFDFGADRDVVGPDLQQPGAWDALRLETDGPFAVAGSREAFEAEADARNELALRAQEVSGHLDQRGAGRVCSCGAGAAVLELCLHRAAPSCELVITDFTPRTIDRLAAIFPEAEVRRHDLCADAPIPADVHLFHRIDTEFTNGDWRTLFSRFGKEEILFVAGGLVGWRQAARAKFRMRHDQNASDAGWVRTRAALESLWRGTHNATPVALTGIAAWHLTPR